MSSHTTVEDSAAARKPVTLHRLRQMHAAGEPVTMLTAYDATFARLLDDCGVDCLLVGDSLGNLVPGPLDDAAGDARAHRLSHRMRGARQPHARG